MFTEAQFITQNRRDLVVHFAYIIFLLLCGCWGVNHSGSEEVVVTKGVYAREVKLGGGIWDGR